MRAVLPLYRDVQRNDTMQCGVALRATDDEVRVHPYLFRLVCTNGAIMAHAVQSRRIKDLNALPVAEAETTLAAALRECGSKEAFAGGMDEVRSALDVEADMMLTLMPFLSQMPVAVQNDLLTDMLGNLHAERDRSGFGLMNAITATARDTDDPDLRWNLEEYRRRHSGSAPVAARSGAARRHPCRGAACGPGGNLPGMARTGGTPRNREGTKSLTAVA